MSTRTPEVKVAPAQPPRVIEGPKRPTGTSGRNLWIVAVVVALVIGVAGGYFVRWGTEPTKTVTNTVTKTVAPPAYATAPTLAGMVRFTSAPKWRNATCTYSGPAEIQAGSSLTLAFSSDESVARLWVVQLQPETTWARFVQEPMVDASSAGPPAEEGLTNGANEGLYGVGCIWGFGVFPATMVRVVP